MLNKKGQTALELLIVLGGILIVGIVVVMILISTGSAKADDITQTDSSHNQLLDKSVFPPMIDNLKCTENDTNVIIEMDVIDSVSKNKKDYCLVINGETTDYCNLPINDKISFNVLKIPKNYYAVGLATRSNVNTVSTSSMTLSCSIAGTGTGTGGTMSFTCPQGYTKIPGNPVFGTTYDKGGFCVMTWEAKVDTNGDGIGETNSTCTWSYNGSTAYIGYSWFLKHPSLTSCDLTTKIQGTDYNIVSSAQGYPLTGVNLTKARNFCKGIGPGYSLITNEEWMTIARNVESQSINWIGGVGTGTFKRGNITGCSVSSSVYSMGSGTGYFDFVGSPSSASKRGNDSPARLVLSNNEIIWDFVGNAREMINKVTTCNLLPIGYDPNSYNQYIEFNQIQNNNSFQDKDYKPGNSTWLSDKGMGKVRFAWNNGTNACYLFSGPYAHIIYNICESTYLTGLYSRTSITGLSNVNGYLQTIGFRCVYIP